MNIITSLELHIRKTKLFKRSLVGMGWRGYPDRLLCWKERPPFVTLPLYPFRWTFLFADICESETIDSLHILVKAVKYWLTNVGRVIKNIRNAPRCFGWGVRIPFVPLNVLLKTVTFGLIDHAKSFDSSDALRETPVATYMLGESFADTHRQIFYTYKHIFRSFKLTHLIGI